VGKAKCARWDLGSWVGTVTLWVGGVDRVGLDLGTDVVDLPDVDAAQGIEIDFSLDTQSKII
jgi:hypothetical protein